VGVRRESAGKRCPARVSLPGRRTAQVEEEGNDHPDAADQDRSREVQEVRQVPAGQYKYPKLKGMLR